MDELEEKPPNLVKFKPKDPNAPLSEFKMQYIYNEHTHGRFLINERRGTILCQICNEYVPSFEAFCLLTEAWQRQHYKFKAIKEYEEREQRRRDREMLRRIAKKPPPDEDIKGTGNPGVYT